MSELLRSLIPDSNRLEVAFAHHNGVAGNLLEACYAEGSGFVGAFVDKPDQPTWARRAARYLRDEFLHDTPGNKKRFSDIESTLPTGDGGSFPNFRHALDAWIANGRKGVMPYSCFQDFGSCVDASKAEHCTSLLGWRAKQPNFGEIYLHACAWYDYANRGYCSDGWNGSGSARQAMLNGLAFRIKYELGGNTVDFTDDDKNERIVAREWCRSGIPQWLKDYTKANHSFEDGAITQFDGGVAELLKVFAAGGVVHCGGTRTSGGGKPFTPGRVGPHMQSGVGADSSEDYRRFCRDVIGVDLADNDFAVVMNQTWGPEWSGECKDQYWPAWWGPKPEGAWVCRASWLLQDIEYAWLPRVKGFPGTGPTPEPVNPPITGLIYPEQAGNGAISIRGQLDLNVSATLPSGKYSYVVAKDPISGKYSLIQKPVL